MRQLKRPKIDNDLHVGSNTPAATAGLQYEGNPVSVSPSSPLAAEFRLDRALSCW